EVITPKEPFTWTLPMKSKILHFLCKDHHLNEERVEKTVDKISTCYHSCISIFEALREKPRHVQLTLDEIFHN
ncbi:MAG: hypothetical protein ACTSVV_11635, partial [Promethearchaeota archaeon]